MDVIIVHADTLRRDHLSVYGYDRLTGPLLREQPFLAIDGYHGTSSWTLPSTASAMFGLTPEHHGEVAVPIPEVDRELVTLASRVGEYGYKTAIFSGNRMVATDPQITAGFDEVLDVGESSSVHDETLGVLSMDAIRWVESLPEGQPYLVWLQPMDTHAPYRPEAPYRGTWADYETLAIDPEGTPGEQSLQFYEAWTAADTDEEREALADNLRAVYDELILQQDAALGNIFAWLASTGRADRTLVVLTADHGETLADDQGPSISHGGTLRPELVSLPLAFYHPKFKGETAECLSSNIDLTPTILRALNLPAPDDIDGVPIQEGCRDLVVSSLYAVEDASIMVSNLTVTDGRYKLDWDCLLGNIAVYDLDADPAALVPLEPEAMPDMYPMGLALDATMDEVMTLDPDGTCNLPGGEASERPYMP